jgi:hypothetical protein
MRKEDYLKLSKERLAELLAERDLADQLASYGPYPETWHVPCYAPNGICTNPYKDCINCPKDWNRLVITCSDSTAGFKCNETITA